MPLDSTPYYKLGALLLGHCLWAIVVLSPGFAQSGDAQPGSRNVAMLAHHSLQDAGAVVVEQGENRPFVHVARRAGQAGFTSLSLADPQSVEVVSEQLLLGDDFIGAGNDLGYFKHENRHFLVLAVQGVDGTGAIVFDVSMVGQNGQAEEVGRIQGDADMSGLHQLFLYKHSDGKVLLFGTGGGDVLVYDMASVLNGNGEEALLTRLPTPDQVESASTGFDRIFVAYHAESDQDRMYGAGAGGYYVFDVSEVMSPQLLTSVSSAAVQRGQALQATPDGNFLVAAAEYRASPLRIFDLAPGLDGTLNRIRTAVGAWTPAWDSYVQNIEVRWPFVFVAGLEDGFQAFNMRDPVNPYTVGYFRTSEGPRSKISDTYTQGAWDIDVRNADGLIVVSDILTGIWVFSMEGFEGWDGRGWGLPNVSSVQDWEQGPVYSTQW